MLRKFRDWLFTVPFLITFGLILLVFDVLQRLARPFGSRPHEIVVGALQWSLVTALRLCGTRFEVEWSEGIRPDTPYIVVSNHQSMFDIPLIGELLFTNYPKFVSKKDLARGIPSISYNLRRGGNAIINRNRRDVALAAIERLGREQVAGRGVSAVIFPEGTRAKQGELGKFHVQGTLALLAAAPEAEVVPFALDGLWRVAQNGMRPVPFGVRVRVSVGAPIPRSQDEDREAILARSQAHIEGALQRWRSGTGSS